MTTPVAVLDGTPANASKALAQTGQSFDKWLQGISDGYLSVETLTTIGGAIPVVGNLISVGNVVVDIMDMSEKNRKKQEVDIFDWMFLG
jgi:hypothetical protein